MKICTTKNVPTFLFLLFCSLFSLSCEKDIKIDDRDAIQELFKETYQDRYNLKVKQVPMVYNGFDEHWTAAIYQESTIYRLYIDASGNPTSNVYRNILPPQGIQNVLCVIVDYPSLAFHEQLDRWEAAQQNINDEHAAYAMAQGFDAPIVQFSNTNVFIEPGVIGENTFASLRAAVRAKGITVEDFDILMLMDLDVENPSGGWADYKNRLLEMGWFYGNQPEPVYELNEETIEGIAFACYHHEIGHIWGWEHEWSDPYDDTGFFITYPILFGWEDMDDDGVPEILDENPYGIE